MDASEIRKIIEMLTREFISEKCAGSKPVEHCMSCEAIKARAALQAILDVMSTPTAKRNEKGQGE